MATSEYDLPPFGEDWSQDEYEEAELESEKPELESPAEEASYPVLVEIARKYGYELKTQIEFEDTEMADYGFRDWVKTKWRGRIPSWVTGHGKEPCGENDCKYCWFKEEKTFVKYRADFVLESKRNSIVVEIDGKQFHQDKQKEDERDQWFEEQEYTVVHIDSQDAFNGNFQKLIEVL
ncbi:MAG: DUF559 domain-containing protein [Patescibacteria group bacterium]|jgi:hypothetical protein